MKAILIKISVYCTKLWQIIDGYVPRFRIEVFILGNGEGNRYSKKMGVVHAQKIWASKEVNAICGGFT